ncbi:patatin-like phospholipase family protein [Frankia sp. CNm7]|uniref:Patatin-like phospholipase family protein n=1 Tax=Frankia nepalensis TaxID=1836974 RepID=A0A937R6D7_9ACTN|nr:patatin-like phospholipase family protein [Frankia nepalensis]MBL7496975.1 patatin-like phospholipase family protein [Frankia nepalensis]MBL7511324.1 patatin-like phospholipase family protein [Frankia nepalensis]MBL7523881.1 patatin-like phospholipase family protein [Frankia nepalensis]MBL7626091.1 patatin-like phospholipase family protein [Frankia nepalensis]
MERSHPRDRVVVLGPGGVVGTAWTIGLAHGLREHGVDLAEADLLIGTSAGAIVGAMLATGQDLARHQAVRTTDGPADPSGVPATARAPGDWPPAGGGRLAAVLSLLGDADLAPAEARRRIGHLAVEAEANGETISARTHVTRIEALVGARTWPERDLLIPVVDVDTGEPRVWDRHGEAPLPAVVAASCAMPAVFPPVTIGGRRYMDGALGSGSNVDLAPDARALIVIEPLAHLFGVGTPSGGGRVAIAPDAAALRVFGSDLHTLATWAPAYAAGARQATETAETIRAVWEHPAASSQPR